MVNMVLRILVNAAALWVADWLLDGMTIEDGIVPLLIVAFIFGVVNAILKPIAIFLTFPALILTLGLFTLIVNGAMLWVTDWISDKLILDDFITAVAGALIISVVSWALSNFLPDKDDRSKRSNDSQS